jgi:arginase
VAVIEVPFHLDEFLAGLRFPLAADRTIAPVLPPGDPWERMAGLYADVADVVAGLVASGQVPVVMSGDCTTSLGVVAGLQRAGVDPALVWFDGHGDLQTPETSTSGYLGGMPVRQLVGGADRTVPDRLGLRDVPESAVVLVDARDLDPPEAAFLARSAVRRDPVEAVRVPPGPLYLHLDVDVVDPIELPGLLFPARNGPLLAAVTAAARAIVATGRVAAVGLACTWESGSGADQLVAASFEDISAAVHSRPSRQPRP